MECKKYYYTYILSNKKHGTLYIGVTNDIIRRITEHKLHEISGFTEKYKLNKLVWFDSAENISDAIEQEKRLKRWHRKWKINLIEENNPDWVDLSEQFMDSLSP